LDLTTTAYYTNFHRNWYKLNDIQDIDTDGDGTGDGLNQNLSAALAGADGGVGLDVLRGDRAGDLRVRANNRDYYAYGVSVDPTYEFGTGQIDHELQLGFRYHVDRISRFQHQDVYSQDSTGAITGVTRGAPGSQDNRRAETTAVAFYVRDEMDFGKLKITPGFRFEHLWQEQENFNSGARGEADYSLFGGGVGASYELDDEWTAFGGIHHGFSPPSPGGAIAGLREETSIATELGLRYQSPAGAIRGEVTGFYTYFDDLIVIDNIGGAGSGLDENVGRVDSYGVELLLQYDPGIAYNWGFSMPNFLSFTWTNAELASDSNSTDAESIFAGGVKGNKVP
jgi:Fe(3+) dicitrate transport protein